MSPYILYQVLQLVSAHQYERALSLLLPLLPLKSLPPSDKQKAMALACFQLGLYCERSSAGFEKAEKLYLQAQALNSELLEVWFALGALFARLGKTDDAEAILAQLEQREPHTARLWLFKGNLAQLTQDFDAAQFAYQQVLTLEPSHAGAWNNLGLLHCQTRGWQEAQSCFQRAVALVPDFAEAWCNLGIVFLNLGQSEAAHSALLQALKLYPQRAETLASLGMWAQTQKKFEQAENYLSSALAQDPNQTTAAIQLTWLYYRQDRWAEAQNLILTQLENPLLVPATQAELVYTQARLYDLLQQRSEAKRCYQNSFGLKSPNPLRQLLAALPGPSDRLFESKESLEAWQEDFRQVVQDYEPGSLCLDDYSQELMQQPVETGWGLLYQGEWPLALKADYTRLFSVPPFDLPARRPGSRLRLGYLVSWEHEGIFLKFSRDLIAHLNCEQFEIYLICASSAIPRFQQAFYGLEMHYLPLSPFLPGNLERIRALDLDVLEFWEVGSDNTNFALAYYRLARVQLTSLGTPVSPCIPGLDLYLSSALLESERPQQHYLEPLSLLTLLPTWYPDLSQGLTLRTRSELGFSEQKHLYLCAQNLLKFHPDFDPLLAGILDQDSEAQIVLFKSRDLRLNAFWQARFEARFPGYLQRLTWLDPLPYAEFLNVLAVADVVLDTPYYGGGNTAHETLAFGTPIVTLPGQTARSRLTLGRYAQMGLEHLAVSDAQAYISQAVLWGSDREVRGQVKSEILARKSRLFESLVAVNEYSEFMLAYLS